MKILVSFILSTILLNLSVHAGSSKKNSPKIEDDMERKKRRNEGIIHLRLKNKKWKIMKLFRDLKIIPRPYYPTSLPEERLQTGDD